MKELDRQPEIGMVQICACGRYMTVISMSKDKTKGSMHFVDCLNDDNRALDMANVLASFTKNNSLINDFMGEYNKMKPHYEKNYNAAELSLRAGELLN